MKWEKLGLLLNPARHRTDWFASHAALPIAQPLDRGVLRVFFSGRDARNRAQIGALVCELAPRPRVLAVEPTPLVCPGELGTFDDSGVTSSCLVTRGDEQQLWYTGWSLGRTVPFYFAVGVAVSTNGGHTFAKRSAAPALDRSAVDPLLVASPTILVEHDLWRMWYVSGLRWVRDGDETRHYYHVRYAESRDGVAWRRDGRVCIDFAGDEEYAIGRPCVRRVGDHYEAWYCHRGTAYRIGYAVSADGLRWERRDADAGIAPGAPGAWDAEMQCYPHVFEHDGATYMLYNGDGFGRSGIGVAVRPPA
ncbi:MAG: hypothetical protein AB7Q17_12805 [Phycisphaerae bacterium]